MDNAIKKFIVALTLLAAFAASSGAFLGVTPSMNELVVTPGEEYSGVFIVENSGDEKALVTVDPQDWWKAKTSVSSVPLEQWLTIKPNKPFALGAGKKKKIKYKISLTPGTTGEVAAMIFFQATPIHAAGGNVIATRNGVSLYVVAKGSANIDGEIKSISPSFAGTALKSALNVAVLVKNTGDVHVRPGGEISVFSKGKLVASAKLEWGWPVYPGQEHPFSALTEKKDWEAGRYTVVVRMDYGRPYSEDVIMQSATDVTIDADGKITTGY
jgi:P pilus assembly chaperone PapD